MPRWRVHLVAFLVALVSNVPAKARAQINLEVIHPFAGDPGVPSSRLLQGSDGRWYGTVNRAGALAAGAVFVARVRADGTLALGALHIFNNADGRFPSAGLIQARDGAFYGTTAAGGGSGFGTVFRITAQGQFALLHSFNGMDGAFPVAALIEGADGDLYGTTMRGGTAGLGVVFKISPTSSFQTLHSFTGADGSRPMGALIQATDGNFYGTTAGFEYAPFTFGTVFRMAPSGGVETLYAFDQTGSAGYEPTAGVIEGKDGALYGATTRGDTPDGSFTGTVFRLTTAGMLSVLHAFDVPPGPTAFGHPCGGVIEAVDGALYGATAGGLTESVFRLTKAGDFSVLHTFNGGDGRTDVSGVVQGLDGDLYGMTAQGGIADHGVFFKVTTVGAFTSYGSFAGVNGEAPIGGVIKGRDGQFYGTTARGGLWNKGTIYRMTGDGAVTVLHSFDGVGGGHPSTTLVQAADDGFYGVTSEGGASGDGTIFRITPAGSFQSLLSFTALDVYPTAALTSASDGALYGMLLDGTFFRLTTGGAFTAIASFPSLRLSGPLVQQSDGNFYGLSGLHGSCGPLGCNYTGGTVFRLTPTGSLTTLAAFQCTNIIVTECPDGTLDLGGLVRAGDGNLYGTSAPYNSGSAVVFRVTVAGGVTRIHRWNSFTEGLPMSPLTAAANGLLYGTGHPPNLSSSFVYSMTTDGGFVSVFTVSPSISIVEPLTEGQPEMFYGTAGQGGPSGLGFVYRLNANQ